MHFWPGPGPGSPGVFVDEVTHNFTFSVKIKYLIAWRIECSDNPKGGPRHVGFTWLMFKVLRPLDVEGLIETVYNFCTQSEEVF